MIPIWYKRIFVSENIQIYSDIRIFVKTLASIRHTEEGPGYDGNIGNMLAAAADQEGEPMFAEADKDQCYNSCE